MIDFLRRGVSTRCPGFRVVDATATPLAYVYALSEGQRAALPGRTLTQAEARAIAEAIAAMATRDRIEGAA